MIKFKKNIYSIFIYMSLYILHICKIIVIIRTHYSNKILIKYIIFGFITKIFFNIVIITIIFFYLSLLLVPIILITSENVSELIKKILKIILFITISYLILNFYIFRYIFILSVIIWNIRNSLKDFYNNFEYYFKNHKIVCVFAILNEITLKIIHILINYVNNSVDKAYIKLRKLPLHIQIKL